MDIHILLLKVATMTSKSQLKYISYYVKHVFGALVVVVVTILLTIDKRTIDRCPYCDSVTLESTPLSYNEVYEFEYDPRRGVTLEFSE